MTTGRNLRADDPPAPSDGGKVVPLKSGGVLKVEDADPYKNLHVPPPTDKYDPRNYSMNQTSSLAGKTFSSDTIAISKSTSDLVHNQGTFPTKPYGALNQMNPEAQTYNTKYSTSNASEMEHEDTQFSKGFATTNSKMGQNSTTSFSSTSPDQNRTAALGDKTSPVFASDLAKQYLGPGAQHVPDGSVKENVVMATVKDIPNRPLTIDEVRGLINHGIKPDLESAAPSESSKALNDPDYKPEASPEPPETSRPPVTEDDKNDPLPPPGTMAQPPPENSVPLPQH